MSDFGFCEICHRIKWGPFHKCPPLWECSQDKTAEDGDWSLIRADDAEQAACNFFGEQDSYSDEMTVFVKEGDAVLEFNVAREMVPNYTATRQ